MNIIAVTFEYNGKQYSGHFSQVSGAGSTSMFHLTVDRAYWGRLRYSDFTNGWCFDPTPKNPGMEALADEFGDLIIAWFQ